MSLILHMKIPGAIVAASDCRITGTDSLYVPLKEEINSDGKKVLVLEKPEDLNPQKRMEDDSAQVPFGHYDFVDSDCEQKTFLLFTNEHKNFAISYCGNANLNGYPTSYQIRTALKTMGDAHSTIDLAQRFNQFWIEKIINPQPSLLISGYNDGKASILELKTDGTTYEHFPDETVFGVAFHGEQSVTKVLTGLGEYQYSLFRLQDAIEFCDTMITTTAKIQSFQRKQQTVSEKHDLLVIMEERAVWVRRDTIDL